MRDAADALDVPAAVDGPTACGGTIVWGCEAGFADAVMPADSADLFVGKAV